MRASRVTSGLVGIWEGDSEFRVGPQPPRPSLSFASVLSFVRCPSLMGLKLVSVSGGETEEGRGEVGGKSLGRTSAVLSASFLL